MTFTRCTAAFTIGLGLVASAPAHAQTVLDDYVYAPDPDYGYTLDATQPGQGYTVYQLTLTSGSWRTSTEVAETLWTHHLTIVKPVNARSRTALLVVSGGSRSSSAPTVDPLIGAYAAKAKSVIVILDQVPNQPLHFPDEPGDFTEDEILAYSFDKALETGDETWPALLPMTRAAVRAMDATQSFLGGDLPRAQRARVDDFVVAGASKRGWTTWLTSAADGRVRGAVPMVIDVLDMDVQLDHHYRAYGFYSWTLEDYVHYDIPCRMNTPEGQALLEIVDPLSYVDRLDMPKYVLNATGDQFFLPDGSTFYFDRLVGEKVLRYVPNVGHSLDDVMNVAPPALEFFEEVVSGARLPRYSWTFEEDGWIVLDPQDTPAAVRLWQVNNPTARDFRIETTGATWTSIEVGASADGTYQARAPEPASGWTAYFLEVEYESDDVAKPLVFSTDVRVIPDVLPSGPNPCE